MKLKKVFIFMPVALMFAFIIRANINAKTDVHPKIMERFYKAVQRFKKTCEKDPNSIIGQTIDAKVLNTNISTNSIIQIGRKLEKNETIGPLTNKIKNFLDNEATMIKKCLAVGDKKCRDQLRSFLRSSAIKSSGYIWALRNRLTCEAAVFAAVAKFIEHKAK